MKLPMKKAARILIAMLAAFAITVMGICLIPPLYQHIMGKEQINVIPYAAGIILSLVCFGNLTAFFSFTNSKNELRCRYIVTNIYIWYC